MNFRRSPRVPWLQDSRQHPRRPPRNMSDSLCDSVDIYLTAVHNMHVRILPDVDGMVASMRRAMTGIALVAAALMLAGCSSAGSPSASSVPSTNGIGPITFAIGKDDIGWLTGVIAGWDKKDPQPEGTP